MQSKFILATTLAATQALKLDGVTTLATDVSGHDDHGHHGYDACAYGYGSYECLEQKVDTTLGALKDEVAQYKADYLVTADDLRAQIVSGVQSLRESLRVEIS
jgi:hypothetical protein